MIIFLIYNVSDMYSGISMFGLVFPKFKKVLSNYPSLLYGLGNHKSK